MDKSLDETDAASAKSDDEEQEYSSDVDKPNTDANEPTDDILSETEEVDSDVGSDVESEGDLVPELEADAGPGALLDAKDNIIEPVAGVTENPGLNNDEGLQINAQDETAFLINDDDDDDTISEDYQEYLQKINKEYTKDILEEYHKEEFHINHDEMLKLSQLKRNDKGFIQDPLHKTTPILSKYEYANIVGIRAKQLADGSSPLTEIPEELIDNYIVAEIELKQKVLPFIVKRPLGHGGCEYWKLSDLEILV